MLIGFFRSLLGRRRGGSTSNGKAKGVLDLSRGTISKAANILLVYYLYSLIRVGVTIFFILTYISYLAP